MDDVTLNKGAIIQRCVRRIQEEYRANPTLDNFSHYDALILNIERACQACIDLAMHHCASRKLGVPQNSAEAFIKLAEVGIIDGSLKDKMVRMTSFRNRAIHLYQELDQAIVQAVATTHYRDFICFAEALGLNLDFEQ